MSIQHEALPPFATLVALESTVRLGSFAAASRELGVSQVAVARKVGELETWLGQPLMTRRRPRVEPTAEALSLAAVVQGGVAQLVAEFERIGRMRQIASRARQRLADHHLFRRFQRQTIHGIANPIVRRDRTARTASIA